MKKSNIILKIGSHVSLSMKNPHNKLPYLLGSLKETLDYGGNAFMIYTGPPQTTKRVSLEKYNVNEFNLETKKIDFNVENIIIHAPYILNLSTPFENKRKFAVEFMVNELKRANYLGVKTIVFHPGNYLNSNIDIGIKQCAKSLNEIFNLTNFSIKLAIETMAGKGTEIGFRFEQIKKIVDLINDKYKKNIGVCLDSCHMHDSGYDLINDLNNVLKHFNDVIGVEKIFAIHVNDSKNPINSRKDRHANIGNGFIGTKALMNFIYHPLLNNKIKILETPWVNGKPIYKKEISLIKNYKFQTN